jgi:hypothetical protein
VIDQLIIQLTDWLQIKELVGSPFIVDLCDRTAG